MTRAIFHLSFPVRDLAEAKAFYCGTLGATVGRDTGEWADILLFGHQLTLHERPAEVLDPEARGVRHFGAILPWTQWQALATDLAQRDCGLLMPPAIAHAGTDKEQGKVLLCDPSGNLIELKAYRNAAAAIGGAMHLSLRPAAQADIDFCQALTRSNMSAYHSARGVVWSPERFIAGWDAFENFMLLADGKVVGLLRLLVVDGALELRDLQLTPPCRDRGIGAWAVDWTKAEAARRGLSLLRLRVFVENPALRLYARQGFKIDSVDGQDKIRMSCAIGSRLPD